MPKSLKIAQIHWGQTVMIRGNLRYCLTSDIFGLAYLVGQIEDELPLGSTGSRGKNQEKRKRLMSNNLIRKGLAVVATVSLAVVGFVGVAPANATTAGGAVAYTLAPSQGTETNIAAHKRFGLKVSPNSGFVVDTTKLKAILTTPGDITVTVVRGTTAESVTQKGTALGSIDNNTDTIIVTSAVTRSLTTGRFAIDASGFTSGFFGIEIPGSTDESASKSVVVKVWEDKNSDNLVDSGEYVSNELTVNFLKDTAITWGLTHTANAATISASRVATVTTNLNSSQMDWTKSAAVVFAKAAAGSAYLNEQTVSVVRNSLTGVLTATGPTIELTANSQLRGQLYYLPDGDAADAATLVADGDTNLVTTATTVQGVATVATVSGVSSAVGVNLNADGAVRSGATTAQVYVDVTVTSGASKSGVPVVFAIAETTGNSLASAASITAGGKTLKNTNAASVQDITSISVLSDAKGRATLDIAATGVLDTNSVTVSAVAQGRAASDEVLTWTAVTIGRVDQTSSLGGTPVFAAASPVSLTYGVVDQWSQPLSGGSYSVSVTDGSATRTGAVVNGVATVTWLTYTALQTGTKSLTFDGQLNGVDVDGNADGTYSILIGAAEAAASMSVGFDATTSLALNVGGTNEDTFKAADGRIGQAGPDFTSAAQNTVSGSVVTASGTAARTSVTLSGTGLDFIVSAGNSSVFARGSVTVQTDASGVFSVEVLSHLAGAKTLTVTSGSVTKTQVLTYVAAAATAGTALTVTAPKSVKAGRTLTITVSLKDLFGNGVDADATNETLKISYSGPGFVLSEPTALSATGLASIRVLLGAGETGPAVVTASVYTLGTTSYLSASSATWVGPIANATAGAKKGRVIIEAYRAKGKTVTVFVGSTRVASYVSNKANFKKVVRGVKSGDRNVRVVLTSGENFRGAITVK